MQPESEASMTSTKVIRVISLLFISASNDILDIGLAGLKFAVRLQNIIVPFKLLNLDITVLLLLYYL